MYTWKRNNMHVSMYYSSYCSLVDPQWKMVHCCFAALWLYWVVWSFQSLMTQVAVHACMQCPLIFFRDKDTAAEDIKLNYNYGYVIDINTWGIVTFNHEYYFLLQCSHFSGAHQNVSASCLAGYIISCSGMSSSSDCAVGLTIVMTSSSSCESSPTDAGILEIESILASMLLAFLFCVAVFPEIKPNIWNNTAQWMYFDRQGQNSCLSQSVTFPNLIVFCGNNHLLETCRLVCMICAWCMV